MTLPSVTVGNKIIRHLRIKVCALLSYQSHCERDDESFSYATLKQYIRRRLADHK